MGKIREVHSPILLRVSLTQSLVFSATQKGKGRKNSTFPTVLAKLSLQQGPFLMEKLYKNVLFVAFVNGVLLQNIGGIQN